MEGQSSACAPLSGALRDCRVLRGDSALSWGPWYLLNKYSGHWWKRLESIPRGERQRYNATFLKNSSNEFSFQNFQRQAANSKWKSKDVMQCWKRCVSVLMDNQRRSWHLWVGWLSWLSRYPARGTVTIYFQCIFFCLLHIGKCFLCGKDVVM